MWIPLLRGCSYPGKNMFFPARIQNSRVAKVSYRILTYLEGGIFENINVNLFWKISTKFDIGFFELTKCNFRRHFGFCLVKNMKKHGTSCVLNVF